MCMYAYTYISIYLSIYLSLSLYIYNMSPPVPFIMNLEHMTLQSRSTALPKPAFLEAHQFTLDRNVSPSPICLS